MTDKKPKLDKEADTRSPFERFADLAKRVATAPKDQAGEKRKSA